MKTAEDRAKDVCQKLNLPECGSAFTAIRNALKEQDRDTRHACVEAVIQRDVKSYKIVDSDSPEDLAKAVNELLPDGWTPQGGVHYFQETRTWANDRKGYDESETDIFYIQAMIQYYDEI